MRISKYGSKGFFGKSNSQDRSAKFRKKYAVGDILHGTLLKWERDRLGWVEIGDQQLLANILTNPSHGDTITFIVEQLYPDIILKEINPNDFNRHGIYINPADATKQFVKRRAAFQSQARTTMEKLDSIDEAEKRLAAFLQQLEGDTKIAVLYFETLKCVSNINSVLDSAKLFYMPWLVPSALDQEIVLKIKRDKIEPDNTFYELLFAMTLPPSGPLRYRIMYKKPQCGFKLLANDHHLASILGTEFKNKFQEFIGIEKIPLQNAGGFLAELLASR